MVRFGWSVLLFMHRHNGYLWGNGYHKIHFTFKINFKAICLEWLKNADNSNVRCLRRLNFFVMSSYWQMQWSMATYVQWHLVPQLVLFMARFCMFIEGRQFLILNLKCIQLMIFVVTSAAFVCLLVGYIGQLASRSIHFKYV